MVVDMNVFKIYPKLKKWICNYTNKNNKNEIFYFQCKKNKKNI
jgi:hypothetical protein